MMVGYVLSFFAVILSIPLWVISCELVISLVHKRVVAPERAIENSQVTFKILMPAHNEAEIIKNTLTDLLHQGVMADNIVVVADNCTDSTALITKGLGVMVLERINADQCGKGYALAHGIDYLKSNDTPDILIVLDADCEITSSSIDLLARTCKASDRPQQALYLMRNNKHASLKQKVAGFAWLVKNKIRPMAVHKLGLPITLTGTGMAFPWQVISNVQIAHGNIVEDMQLGIDCTLSGAAPQFCEQAVVYSDFPEHSEAAKTQRTRWEHGHLMTIMQQVPHLIKQAILQKDGRLLTLALDIGVPPLSLLVMFSIIELSCLMIYSIIDDSYGALLLFLTVFVFFAIALISTWLKFGRVYLTIMELCSIPVYILSKITIYITFIFKRQSRWIKTKRDSD